VDVVVVDEDVVGVV
jgi:hypothetical protein